MDTQTVIGDLAAEGETLDDDKLRLVSGGQRPQWCSKTIDIEVGMTDVDAGF